MSAAARTAFVAPDVATWLLHGQDPRDRGFALTVVPERAGVLVVPKRVPAGLSDALSDAWHRMPPPREYVVLGDPIEGDDVAALLDADAPRAERHDGGHDHDGHDGDHGGHDGHDGGHDHGDMMAIEGDPSADGLIMEPIDFSLGPLAASLPGGLVVDLSLDGDIVMRARVRATLAVDGHDPLAPLASRVARQRAATATSEGAGRRQIAALESERALSHALSLTTLGSAMGWRELADAAHELSRFLAPLHDQARRALDDPDEAAPGGDALRDAERALPRVDRLVRSRRPRRRLAGRGVIDREIAEAHDLGGPVARAAGVPADARSGEPLYAALGFAPEVASDGDAAARADVRVAEIAAALRLTRSAAAEAGTMAGAEAPEPRGPVAVEGPRGRVVATPGPDGGVVLATPGADPTGELAGYALIGLELGTAVVTLASFDLSPWRLAT